MRRILKDKKGFAALIPLVLTIGVAIVLLGVMASLAANTRDTLSDSSVGVNTSPVYTANCDGTTNYTCTGAVYNVTNAGLSALDTLGGYWGIIVTIGAFTILLGALMGMFQSKYKR